MAPILGVFAGFSLSLGAGWAVVRLSWPRDLNTLNARCLRALLVAPVGFGVTSLPILGWRICGGDLGGAYRAFDAILCLALLVLGYFHCRGRAPLVPPAKASRDEVFLMAVAGISIGALALIGILASVDHPFGQWDAWAIWNQRARFLLVPGAAWRSAFSPELSWSHPEYPLLLPSSVARLWSWEGSETQLIPALISLVMMLCGAGIVAFGAAMLSGLWPAAIAVVLLAATPEWAKMGASQYADVPLACYVVAALVLLRLSRSSGASRLAILAGLIAGFAAWTKSEGQLALLVIVASEIVGLMVSSGRRVAAASAARMLLGAALPFVALAIFRLAISPPIEILSSRGSDLVSRFSSIERFEAIGKSFWVNRPGADFNLLLVMTASAVLLSIGARELLASTALRTVVLLLAGYFVVLVITPYNLDQQLATATDRLLIQVWPSLLFAIFSSCTLKRDGSERSSSDDTIRERLASGA